ncbi:MAG: vWA domain-containing protein [Sulfuricaulis sp.]
MHHHTLLKTLPIVAVMLGKRVGIDIKVGGDEAFTDGRTTIVIPELDPRDEEAEILAYGYLGHEIGHVQQTDFDLLEKSQHGKSWTPLKKSLWNILEDIYSEKKEAETYPGISTDIACLVERLVKDGALKPVKEHDNPASVLQKYLLYRMRNEVLGQTALEKYAQDAEIVFRSQVSKGFAAKVGSLIGRVSALQSTKDCIDLTDELIRTLKDEEENKPPENGAGNENAGGDGHQSLPPSSPSSTGHQSGQTEDEPLSHAPDMRSVAKQILEADERGLDKDLGQMIKDKLDQKAEEAQRSAPGGAGAGVGVAEPPSTLMVDPTELIARACSATNALRVRLGSLVEATLEEDDSLERSGAFIDSRSLYRTATGDSNVFVNINDETGVSTAFVILLDRSGSMATRIDVAREAALSVCLALNEIPGMAVACAGFPSHMSATGVLPLTEFGEAPLKTASRYEAVNASGGTPMTEAIWWGACQLAVREEPRKIMLVVTDGDPDRIESARETIRIVGDCDVEMMGLGIQSHSVTGLFPVHAVIDTTDQLASAMFGMLQSALLSKAA